MHTERVILHHPFRRTSVIIFYLWNRGEDDSYFASSVLVKKSGFFLLSDHDKCDIFCQWLHEFEREPKHGPSEGL